MKRFLLVFCMFFLSSTAFAYDLTKDVKIKRVIVEQGGGTIILQTEPLNIGANGCSKNTHPRWRIEDAGSKEIYAAALAAAAANLDFEINTIGCIGNYAKIVRVEIIF